MMFVIQVKTGCEASAAATLTRLGFNIKAPQKVMRIRKGGVWKHEVKPVFPGYIFLEADTYIEAAGYYKVKKTSGVVNFLGKGEPQRIQTSEAEYINWLWNSGAPLNVSKVFVTPEGKKMIMSGPLRNYSGEYIEFDLRQKRAKIRIPICGVIRNVTLPIECI